MALVGQVIRMAINITLETVEQGFRAVLVKYDEEGFEGSNAVLCMKNAM